MPIANSITLSTENYGLVSKEGSNKVDPLTCYADILSCEKQQFLEQVPSDHQWEPLHPETKKVKKATVSTLLISTIKLNIRSA